MNELNVAIAFAKTPITEDSLALKELRESLEESRIFAEPEIGEKIMGVKDGGLTVGLTIAGLALSAIGHLVSAISLWASKKNYSVTFKTGETTFAANNLSAKEALLIGGALKDKAVASDIKVLVSRK
jgi:hypothetical protein